MQEISMNAVSVTYKVIRRAEYWPRSLDRSWDKHSKTTDLIKFHAGSYSTLVSYNPKETMYLFWMAVYLLCARIAWVRLPEDPSEEEAFWSEASRTLCTARCRVVNLGSTGLDEVREYIALSLAF